jgi:LVIVD repeat-containing protein
MEVVVAAASAGSPEFAVINFGNRPPTVVMTRGFQNGNVVDCYGTLAAVGENSGYSVTLFDISAPASPVQTGSVKTGFQIGSISIYGSYVLTGELSGSRVSLIDISNPASPYVLSVSDCAPLLNIISSVSLRSPTLTDVKPRMTAVVSGDNNSIALYFEDPAIGAVPVQILYNAWPSDFDGWTAAVANADGGIYTYAVSGNRATKLALVPYREATGSVAVAEIPAGGYYVAASGEGSFTVFAHPSYATSGSLKTSLTADKSSPGIALKFLNDPAIAPFLAVANVTASGVFVSYYFIELETGLPQGSVISFFKPIPVAQVALAKAYVPTLGITAFTPSAPPRHGRSR